jgi:DNA-binding NarL/FixJ family response regulator
MKKIILIEDNLELKEAIKASLLDSEKYTIINDYDTGEEAVNGIKLQQPDMIIMDIQLKGKMNGIECTSLIKTKYPKVDIVMFTIFEQSEHVFEALKAGASGYITKNKSVQEIIEALNEIELGGAPMSFNIAKMVINSFAKNQNSSLTPQESTILTMLSKGGSYKSAATELKISIQTIKFHIKNIYIKLQVSTKSEALHLARVKNWI